MSLLDYSKDTNSFSDDSSLNNQPIVSALIVHFYFFYYLFIRFEMTWEVKVFSEEFVGYDKRSKRHCRPYWSGRSFDL